MTAEPKQIIFSLLKKHLFIYFEVRDRQRGREREGDRPPPPHPLVHSSEGALAGARPGRSQELLQGLPNMGSRTPSP